jgi:hypothetical protein
MSDPGAFKRALADAARQVADAGGPEIMILAELDTLGRDSWGLRFILPEFRPDIKHALLKYRDDQGQTYTDLGHPIPPIPGALSYNSAEVAHYAQVLGERVTTIKRRFATGDTDEVLRARAEPQTG